jgi:hypothetical protein
VDLRSFGRSGRSGSYEDRPAFEAGFRKALAMSLSQGGHMTIGSGLAQDVDHQVTACRHLCAIRRAQLPTIGKFR